MQVLFLSRFPNSWERLEVFLSNSASNDKLSMSMVNDALFNEKAKRKDVDTDQSHALVTKNKERYYEGSRDWRRRKRKVEQIHKCKKAYLQVLLLWHRRPLEEELLKITMRVEPQHITIEE